MPRSASQIPTPRRHANGQAYVFWRGATHYLGKWNTPSATEAYRRFIIDLDSKKPTPKNGHERLTIRELVDEFNAEKLPRYSAGERSSMKVALAMLTDLFGSDVAEDFGLRQLLLVRRAMIAKGWCRRTINARVSRLKRLFRWAASDAGLVLRVPPKTGPRRIVLLG